MSAKTRKKIPKVGKRSLRLLAEMAANGGQIGRLEVPATKCVIGRLRNRCLVDLKPAGAIGQGWLLVMTDAGKELVTP